MFPGVNSAYVGIVGPKTPSFLPEDTGLLHPAVLSQTSSSPTLGALVHEAVAVLVAPGQAVQLLQQFLHVILLHSSSQEAGPAPQVESGELSG